MTPNIKMQRPGPQIPVKCKELLPAADHGRWHYPVYNGHPHKPEEVMQAEKTAIDMLSGIALRFAAGACMGALIIAVPFSAGFSSQLSMFQIALAVVVILTTGVMSCLWGDKVLDIVSRALDSTSV